jgi:CHASE2 domain-containing sensor protein
LPGSAGRKVAIVTHSEVAISMMLTTTAKTIEEAEKAFTDEYQLLVPLSEADKHRILITGE